MILLLGRHHCQEGSMRIHMWSGTVGICGSQVPSEWKLFHLWGSPNLLSLLLLVTVLRWMAFPTCGTGAQSILSAKYNRSLHSHCLMLSKESGYEFIYCLHDEDMCSVAEGTSWVIYCFICTTSIPGCTESLLDTQLLDKPVHEA